MKLTGATVLKILRSSQRVQKARDMIGLEDDEYVCRILQGGVEIGNRKKIKTRIIKKIQEQSASMSIHTKVIPYIEKEVIAYFGLPISALKVVLMERYPWKGYSFSVDYGERLVTIKLPRKLNTEELNLLFDKIRKINDSSTKEPDFEKIKPIEFFDEKFLLKKKYEALRKKYPTEIPEDIRMELVQEARDIMGIKANYTADSFRKTMSEFNEKLEG
ncbi:hypothetical protein M0P48_00515 [Candidatus Gracilibacteria bacterium]|jgi:hypothetical protein|nr:hypothetical protein [Candidatus Gracilibacteria bacterium]